MKQRFLQWTAIAVALACTLAGCTGGSSDEPGSAAEIPVEQEAAGNDPASWDLADATRITLQDTGIEIAGAGAAASGTTLTISSAGTYLLSGTLSAGQVIVDAPKDATVRLVLDSVQITASDHAAIYNQSADTLILSLPEGTASSVSDAADFNYADSESEEPNAAIFSKNSLTIEGEGALTVQASHHNGIGAKDDLLITGGVLEVTAANHGLRGRDSVVIQDGALTVIAGNDGIQSNNDGGEDVGYITLSGGSYAITAGHDAIQAESSLTISGGDFTITAGGGALATPVNAEGDTSDSYKGIKAGGSIVITGGTFQIDSADDALHANGDIRIDSGEFTLSTGDDGIHADGDLTIHDGSIQIPTSYEGLEAFTMTIAGGVIDITSSDDGINVAGGTDTNAGGGRRFGADQFALNGDRWLKITGGHITVSSGGDGIDINGNGEMTGGEVYITSSVNGPDSALDYDGTFVMTGGIMIGSGSSAMAMTPGNDSTQPSLMVYYTDIQPAGTVFELVDAQGNLIASFTPGRDYQNLLISTPDLQDGQSYTVRSGGETLLELTLSGAATRLSDIGEAVTGGMGFGGGMGGRGGPGGGQPPEGFPGDRPEGAGERPEGGGPGGDRPSPGGNGMPTPGGDAD